MSSNDNILFSFCLIYGKCSSLLIMWFNPTGAEEKMNVELIVPIGAVVIAMFLWLLIVFVIRNRKRVTLHSIPLLVFSLFFCTLTVKQCSSLTDWKWLSRPSLLCPQPTFCSGVSRRPPVSSPILSLWYPSLNSLYQLPVIINGGFIMRETAVSCGQTLDLQARVKSRTAQLDGNGKKAKKFFQNTYKCSIFILKRSCVTVNWNR